MINRSVDMSLRAQMLTLSYCTLVFDQYITAATNYSISQIYRIRHIAKDREFDSAVSLQILDKYIRHAVKSDRSIKATVKKEEEVIKLVVKNRYAREKFTAKIEHDSDLFRTIV
jgi:hypothetical protein